jgi:hypothetical protein
LRGQETPSPWQRSTGREDKTVPLGRNGTATFFGRRALAYSENETGGKMSQSPAAGEWLPIALGRAGPGIADECRVFGDWRRLFNGTDTSGWIKADVKDTDHPWKVRDGTLTNAGDVGMDICSEGEFSNYELQLDYRLPGNHGNSGVYLRGQIELQIDAAFGVRHTTRNRAGAIFDIRVPRANAQKPIGQWNRYRIRHLGYRITVWHNGVLIHDNVFVDQHTIGTMIASVAPGRKGLPLDLFAGPVMLQGDRSEIWYRNIFVRNFCAREDGWTPLWNDRDLSEFTTRDGNTNDYWMVSENPRAITNASRHDGSRTVTRGQELRTLDRFRDCIVFYEYCSDSKVAAGGAGFLLPETCQLQLPEQHGTGDQSADAALGPRKPMLATAKGPAGSWNAMVVRIEGSTIWVWQNGKRVYDGVALDHRAEALHGDANHNPRPFQLRVDQGRVWFRNLWIKQLSDNP